MSIIQPRTLQGFRDFLPDLMLARESILDRARAVFRSFGFAPIDTPSLEYLEILTGKGGEETDRQLYRFEDHGGRQVGLRFDLTVPLARFAAQHIGQLGTPFKRYHLGMVWRGERAQRGRYREFMQCDFDTIGTTSLVADIEIVQVIYDLLRAIGVERFRIHINNRKVLNGLLERFALEDRTAAVLRAIDKLPKIGREAVEAELRTQAGLTAEQAERVLALSEIHGDHDEVLERLAPLVAGSERGEAGLAELRDTAQACHAVGIGPDVLQLDVSIARGLDYYTGTVYETFLSDLPGIGSVCSGGRYDDLASLYTRQRLPGVGASLGVDRLIAALDELGLLPKAGTPADVLIAYFDRTRLHDYLRIATDLRRGGVGVELYPEPKKLGQQLKYADRKGFPFALIAGDRELDQHECQLKDLATGESVTLSLADGAEAVVRFVREHRAR